MRQQLRHVIMSHVRTTAPVSLMKYQPSVFVRQNSLVYSVNTEKVSGFRYSKTCLKRPLKKKTKIEFSRSIIP